MATTLPKTVYRTASPETWSLIRGAYLSGLSAPAVGARFGVSEGAIRKRAAREGWTKRDFAARATPWPGGRAPDAGATHAGAGISGAGPAAEPAPGSLDETEARILERWKQPPHIHAADVARKALAGAAHALKAGEGLNALRLARAAAEIARLDALLDFASEDVAESEQEAEGRHAMMQLFLRERALSLAEDIVAGRPLPPEFEETKAELARIAALGAALSADREAAT